MFGNQKKKLIRKERKKIISCNNPHICIHINGKQQKKISINFNFVFDIIETKSQTTNIKYFMFNLIF